MADVYNSAKLRDAAQQIDQLSLRLEDGCAEELGRAAKRLEPWQGRAQEACVEQLGIRRGAIADEARCLREIAGALRAYADRLEAIDQETAAQIS